MEGEHNNNVVLLSPESQLLLSMIGKKSELPSYVDGTLNEAVNDIANEVLRKVRKSIVDILFVSKVVDDPESENREHGLTKTIVDKDWHMTEKRIETAIRFFPDVVVEQHRGYYPIQWMAMRDSDTKSYNLMSVSLILLMIKMAIEFRSFDDEVRGGVLSLYPSGNNNTLQHIICYYNEGNDDDNKLVENCFSTVRNWMRGNYLVTKDIQLYDFFRKLFAADIEFLSESRLQYLIDMDPVPLSLSCCPEKGNMVPIHWSTNQQDIPVFSSLLKAGMQHYPDKFGYVFSEGTHRDNNTGPLFREIPFQQACEMYGQEKVTNEFINCIHEYCSVSASTSRSAANNNMETSLLMSAIIDESIHFDCLYILLRKDPAAALLKLKQTLRLLVEDEQTVTDTNPNNKNRI